MTVSGRAGNWAWPFLWVLLVPLFSLPATAVIYLLVSRDCTGGGQIEEICPMPLALSILAPGVANLAPVLAVLSRDILTRRARAVATALGFLRFVAPAAIYLAQGAQVNITSAATVSIGLWVLTAVLFGVFVVAVVRGRRPFAP